jgi:Neocarzinostatin family
MLSIRSHNYRWLAVTLSLAAFCALAAPALAKKMKGPKATASPNANLTNNEMVTVTGSGFVAGSEVFLVECNKGIKGQSGAGGVSFCEPNPPHLVGPIKITSEGTLPPTSFTVFTGTVGNRTCGTSKKDKNCYIGVGNVEGSNNDSALAKIKFVP